MEYFGSYYSDWPCLNSELGGWQNRYSTRSVGAFDVCVVVFLATAIFLASVHGKCFTIYCRCWCHFYEVQQSIVNFGTWTINQSDLWQLKKTRKIKTASCQNGGCGTRKLVKLDLSLEYPGWVSILCQRWTDPYRAPKSLTYRSYINRYSSILHVLRLDTWELLLFRLWLSATSMRSSNVVQQLS